jgi:hypothetical protein
MRPRSFRISKATQPQPRGENRDVGAPTWFVNVGAFKDSQGPFEIASPNRVARGRHGRAGIALFQSRLFQQCYAFNAPSDSA